MVIQDLVEIIDGVLERVKWNILLKYFIFYLENAETYYKEIKTHPNMYRTSLEGNPDWWWVPLRKGAGRVRVEVGRILTFAK